MIVRPLLSIGLAVAGLALFTGAAAACPQEKPFAGVVQRVTGQRGDVYIERAGTERIRPAPMETLCEGDVVVAGAQGASITLRLDGAASSTVVQGPGSYKLPVNARRASVVDNALQLLMETWMPDIKRSSNFGVVRGRTGEPPRWALAGMDEGAAAIRRGERPLYLRWSGDPGLYRVEVSRADGAVVEKRETSKTEIRLGGRNWSGGPYVVKVYEGGGRTPVLEGRFRAGDPPPSNATPFPAGVGEEVRAAAEALRLVSLDAERWSLEALQIIDRAPAQGLDREALYRSIGARDDDADGTPN
ncbi:MAG: hypothetical protein NW200_08820 [Hyphomonadaceae bacterium]|nr:hypothetical protein [Hyphomonadaceae bacterium]